MITGRGDEHLCLVFQPAKRLGVQDAVAVALELGAEQRRLFRSLAPLAGVAAGGIRRERTFAILQQLPDALETALGLAVGRTRHNHCMCILNRYDRQWDEPLSISPNDPRRCDTA